MSLRYRLSRCMIHAGLMLMPEGRYKTELLEVLWTLHDKVLEVVEADKQPPEATFDNVEDMLSYLDGGKNASAS